jgi:hypothetical protein
MLIVPRMIYLYTTFRHTFLNYVISNFFRLMQTFIPSSTDKNISYFQICSEYYVYKIGKI